MVALSDLFKQHKLTPDTGRASDARTRLLKQADSMLKKLAKMQNDSELETDNTTQNWWASKRTGTQRRVTMRYGGKVVENSGTMVDDNIAAVRARIELYKKMIADSTAETWAGEEARRQKK